ncbi:outer membrane receptor protein involved in Fe transport [Agrobacterium vitis]|nr:outer membrane receptor protein involved in Fe transport [Agrobacterium vitis]MBE1436453.1 outer membrane receptor protein involved in Fe transport [Agrobacterium vitis]
MSSHLIKKLMLGGSVFALSAMGSFPVLAQDATGNSENVTELAPIIVTGENVERSLKKTASSVSVINDKDIDKDKTGDSSVSETILDVPNVMVTDTVSAPIIRGQDTQGPNTGSIAFLSGTVPRATINLDGHYLNYYEYVFGATSVWDLQNIEVFRGPQTTSQGANAIAGAIVVNTKDPTFTPEASYLAEIGSYNMKRIAGAVSGPIIDDQLAARLAIDYSGRDTFIDYINSSFSRGDTNQDFSSLNGRFKLLWEPDEITGFSAKLTYSYNASNRPSQEAAFAPFENLDSLATTMPSWKQHTNTGVLDLKYELENGITVFNQTQYSDTLAERYNVPMSNAGAVIDQKNVSNETRVTFGDEEDVFSGVVGLYYANTKSDEVLYYRGTSSFDDTKDNLGIFSEASYRLTDEWTLTGGLRFERDQVQRIGTSTLATSALNYDETFTAFLPKLSLSYEITPDVTVGAMVNRGYNPGGVSLNTSSGQWLTFKEETLWNYELFTRANLIEDKLFVTGNVFYMDMKNAQRYVNVLLTSGVVQPYTVNADKAHAYGAEFSVNYAVLDNVNLKGGAGIMRTEIDEMSSNASYEGNEFQKSPGYTLSFGASWDVTEKFNVAGDIRYLDGYYSDDANTTAYWIEPYTVADVRASYKFNDKLEAYTYVKNVFDERVPTFKQYNRGIGGVEASMTSPRTFGIGIKGTF